MKDLSERINALTPEQRAVFELLRKSSKKKPARPGAPPPLLRRAEAEPAPLSFDQERLWFLQTLDPQSVTYNIGTGTRVEGRLDVPALAAALNEVVRRHEAWRTVFAMVDGRPVQTVVPELRPGMPVVDLRGVPAERRRSLALGLTREQVLRPFDLERGPLLRVLLVRLEEEEHLCLLAFHHIITDWISSQISWQEMAALYVAAREGRPSPLPEPPVQYSDFAVWQREWLQGEVLEHHLDAWLRELEGVPQVLELATDRPRPLKLAAGGGMVPVALPPPVAGPLRALARQEGATPFIATLTAYSALLFLYSGQERFLLGSPNANRNQPELQGLLGFFLSQLVFPVDVSGDPSFRELLGRVKKAAFGAYAHQELPFGKLVEALRPERDPSRAPLAQGIIQLVEGGGGEAISVGGLTLSEIALGDIFPKFDIAASLVEIPDGIRGWFEYPRDLWDHTSMQRLAEAFEILAGRGPAAPEVPLSALPLFSEAGLHQVLHEWNDTAVAGEPRTADRSFEEQAARDPGVVAVAGDGRSHGDITYGELNRAANRLAHRLRRLGVGPEVVRVGLCLERGPGVLVGMLAVWKAGGAWVPLDPAYPQERLSFLIEDSGVAVVVAQPSLLDRLPGLRTVCWDGMAALAGEPEGNPEGRRAAPEDLAYVLYTSGTTGLPKGAMVEHGSLAAVLQGSVRELGWRAGDHIPCLAPFSFDVFLFEAMGALVSGGTVDLIPLAPVLDLDRLLEALGSATRVVIATSLMRQIIALMASSPVRTGRLRTVYVGGEAVPPDLIAGIRPAFPGVEIGICYGPTEATILCTVFMVPPEGVGQGKAMLGRPLDRVGISIRRRDGGLAPVGVPGELWIAGAGVGRGYLDRPELTAERFVIRDGRRWYRTGDLARWLADGTLEFTGRLDDQVKIRGFRVEPGEVAAQLAEHPGVREVAVLVRSGEGTKHLAAYVVPAGESGNGFLEELHAWAAGRLPEHLVPSFFTVLPELPLTANGKLDRKALLALEPGSAAADRTAPGTPAEEVLAGIWRGVLGVAQVGVHDNFFRLGGDSILSIQVVARARQAGWVVTPQQMFEHQTIASLALVARPAGGEVEEGAVEGEAPLTAIQRRFFAELAGVPEAIHQFNQAVLFETRGALVPALGARALAALALHHDALRLRFASGRAVHAPAEEAAASFPMTVVDLSALAQEGLRPALEDAAEQAQSALHLEKGPLARAVFFERGAGRSGRLLLAIHHLVVDGVSWRILLEDLQTAYGQLAAGGAVRLLARTTSWKRWAELMSGHARSDAVREELGFWLSLQEVRPLPVDRPATGNGTMASRRAVTVSLSREATAALLQEAPAAYRTQVNDLLLTALARAFSRWTGEDRLRIDLEGHGREEVVPGVDLSRTVGWFTTAVPIVLDVSGAGGPGGAIRRVKEGLRAIPRKGIGYGLLRWGEDAGAAERLAALPPTEVGFNYLGQLDTALGEGSLFAPAGESPGLTQSPRTPRWARIEVDARVLDDRLGVDWGYSADLYDEATIARLAAWFREELEALVEHCLSPEAGGFTPSDFSLAGLDQETIDRLLDQNVADVYPLSPLQEGMLFHTLYSPESEIYFEQMTCTLAGPLDLSAFRRAWQEVVDRQPVLRTSFAWEGLVRPVQIVRRGVEVPIQVEDWRGRPEAWFEGFVAADRARRFDLARAPLLRLALLRTGEAEHRMVWSFHHILMDGWCLALVLREVLIHYEAGRRGASVGPLEPVRPYRDYIAWLLRQDLGRAERVWREELAGFAAPTPVPFDHPARGAAQRADGFQELKAILPAKTVAGLEPFQRQGLTLNTVVQGAWALLLSRWSGERNVVFGGVVSGRPPELPGIETAVGLFINTLPVRVGVDPGAPGGSWLRALQERQVRQRELEWSPLSEIRRWSEVPPGEPLFHSLLVFENYPLDPTLGERLSDLEVRDLAETELTNYPLTLVAALRGAFLLRLTFDHRFETATARRMLGHLETLLAGLAARPEGPLGELPLLSEAERHQLTREHNRGAAYPVEDSLDRLFAAQVARDPGAVAVTFEGAHLTYGELDTRANQLARRLRRLGVGPEVLVGLCAERSLEMVVGLLGILKAGGAYLPLDPSYPEERLRFMLEDARAPVLLTQERWRERFAGGAVEVLCLEDGSLAEESPEGLEEAWPVDRLAYAIYTSGSTGRPKGTLVTHRNVVRLFAATEGWFNFGEGDVWTLFHSYAFDFSVWELWGAFLYGGRLVVVPYWVSRSPEAFHRLLREEGVTVLNQTPSAFRQLVAAEGRMGEETASTLRLRFVIFGGEALDLSSLKPWFDRHGDRSPRLINMYGITETTVHVTYRPVAREDSRSPIGVPIPDLRVHLLGPDGELVPVGAPGEIHVGGPGLARGYLGRPELTAQRFVPDPFAVEPGARLYRAGDLARRLASGELQYLGRIDHQVKIRGFRIEPGEIEAALAAHPGVREAVVLPWEGADGDRRLAAWIVPRGEEPPSAAELRGFLEGRLPAYMVPAAFVPLDALPLTPQGKLDRRALPMPGVSTGGGTAPRTPAEGALAAVWREVLGVERVGVHDSFFALGGDSILSIQVVSRARQAGWVITPQQIFEHQTIAAVAAVARPAGVAAEQGPVEGEAPLTPIQRRFFAGMAAVPEALHHYNQAVLFEVRGALVPSSGERVFAALAAHHDALRLRFASGRAVHAPVELAAASFPFTRIDLAALPEGELRRAVEEAAGQAQTGLALERGPLARAVLFARGPGRTDRLLLALHHLVVDGVSWRILLEDLRTAWEGGRLPEKTTSWKRWAERLAEHARSAAVRDELPFWLSLPEVPSLPVDRPAAGAGTVGSRRSVSVSLPPEATATLLKEAPAAYRRQVNDLLLTALAQAFSRWTGEARLLVDFEGHGREEVVPGVDLSRTMGWFTTLYPVVLDLTGTAGPGDAIRWVKESLREVPGKGIGHGLLRWMDGEGAEQLAARPAAEVSFNYLGQLDAALGGDGLLAPADESAGLDRSPLAPRWYRIEVDAMVLGDRLRVGWGYSADLHDEATIARLAEGFREALEALIAHCLSPEAGGFMPSDFPLARLDQGTLDRLMDRTVEDAYPLSPLQEGMLFHTLYTPGSEIYFEQMSCTLAGPLDVPAFTRAWQEVVDRHSVLRSSFAWERLARPVQIVHRGVAIPLDLQDWRGAPPERLGEFLAADRARGFDLSQAPLMRLALLRTGEEEHRLVWSFHHLLLDGWCLSLVFREVLLQYNARRTGVSPGPPEPALRYRDYIAWLLGQDLARAERAWREELAGFDRATPLPFDHPGEAPARRVDDFRELKLVLPAPVQAALEGLRARGVTPNTAAQGAWALLLSRWSGERDVVFGGVVSGRPAELPGIETAIGLFINTLPVRVGIDPGAEAWAWLRALQERQVRQRELEWSPLSEVQRWSELPPGEALFHSLVVFENYPIDRGLGERLTDFDVRDVLVSEQTNYPLTLTVEARERIKVEVSFDRRFDAPTAQRLLGGFTALLEGLATCPDRPVEELSPLSAAERHQLTWEQSTWDGVLPVGPADACLHELFELQVERTPEALALVDGGASLTYAGLNRRANRLAHALRDLGVGPEVRVGLCVERSAEMVVALLGILKAGGAYVPLDPETPPERLAFLLEDALAGVAAPLLVTEAALAGALPETRARKLVLDDPAWQSSPRDHNPASGVTAENLGYVIYTSGSTGVPKGVMVRHRSAVAYVRSMGAVYGIGPGDRSLLFASISFDASVEEVFTPLSRGASFALQRGVDDVAAFLRKCREERLTHLSLPTAYWHQIAAAVGGEGLELPPELRLVVMGGERALPERWAGWGRSGGAARVRLVNAYGPTEAAIAATIQEHPRAAVREVPIGRPLPGVVAHVLDQDLRPVPLGAPGELCLGGVGLARGYLDRPGLTAERFVPDPFGGPGERLYRTGDLVRRLADGTLEFSGRVDAQVKIRGFRVEPGEIEAALARHPAVRQAAVLPWEGGGGELRLAAWVAVGEPAPAADALRDFVAERLPAFMVPAAFVLLDSLPLTPQGKLDRRALPPPGRAAEGEEGWTASRTPAEEALAAIWRDLLGVERVGVHDNFFRLGGDSILSIQVVARARQAGLSISPRQIFENPTVAALAALAVPTAPESGEEGPVSGEAPLTPIQREFLEGDPVDPHHFNQALLLTAREAVDPGRLAAALDALVRHHDALRLRFLREGAVWRQVHAPLEEAGAGFIHVDLSGLEEGAGRRALETSAASLQGVFDLARGPLLRGALFTMESGARLLLAAHHLVVDGVSWRILLEDLETAYGGRALPAKTTSWKRWAERLAEHARSASAREELETWLSLAGAETPPLPGKGSGGAAGAVSVSLPEEVTASLLREAPEAYRARVDDLLLTALAQAFEGWTGQPRLRIDLEGHGREEIAPDLDLSRTVGWFTSVFPVVLDLEGVSGPGGAIRRVKERLRQIPGRGIGYGLLRYLSGDPEAAARLAALPAAEAGFNYLGQLDRSLGEGARWSPTLEDAGPARSPRAPLEHTIEVNAWVLGGRLQVSWAYDAARFREETMAALARGFTEALAGLVEHCLSPDAGGFTPSDFPLAGLDQATLDALLGADRTVEDLYPLTPIQEGMLFTELYAPEAGIYFEHMAGTLRGPLDAAAFRRAWQAALDRHPALRSALFWREVDRPLQVVRRGVELPWSEEDWRGEADPDARLLRWLAADRVLGLDLSRAPLMRAALLRTGGDEHRFVWSFHHVLFDGWCNALILRDVFLAYEAFRQGREPVFPPVRPYRDFIAWLGRRDPAGSEGFWRAFLAGFDAPTPLPFDLAVDPDPAAGPREEVLTLSTPATAALGELAASRSLTLSTVLQGAWALLLSRWGGGSDVAFGVVVSGRPAELPGVESMIGLFINTLPARVRIEPAAPLAAWLREIQAGQLELRQHEHDPLPQVQRWSEVPAGEPLFHSLVVFENYPVDRETLAAASGHLEIEGFELAEKTNYPLTAAILPGRELRVRASHSLRLEPSTVRRLLRSLETLLEAMAAGPDLPLEALPALSEAERHQALLEHNAGAAFAAPEEGLDRLFEAQAARAPGAVAVTFEGGWLTYGELNARANQLARRLRRLGVGPDVLVGLAVERSLEMVVGILGILKAGGAYVPLDPSYPGERLRFTLEDARIPVLVTQESLRPGLPAGGLQVLCLDAERELDGESPENLSGALPADRLAYVIYTSGTTGRPKGTLITHRNVTRLFAATDGWFGFGEEDVWTLFHSFAFDFSVWELWGALLYGGRLVVVPYWVSRSPEAFHRLLREEGVTVLNQTPSAFRQLIAAEEEEGAAGDLRLRLVIFGGEALDPGSLTPWLDRHGDRSPRLVNMYGITETTVHVTYRPIGREDLGHAGRSPIGVPIPDLRGYVLGPDRSPVPAGAPGEIYVGGPGLARGYLDRPELTAERFVPDPFAGLFGETGARLYKTGDLARSLPDGGLQFLGRIDQQVKVRGHRIELGEVEAALAAHPGVREAAATTREDASGGRRLVAFAVPRRPGDPLDDLRAFLAGRLPEPMVPSEIGILEARPLGPTGKLDRRALAALAPVPAATAGSIPPRNPVEEELAAIWRELLGVERVGVGDDFFALGGHSLLATQLATRIRRQLGVDLPLPRIFELRTLEGLAREILARTLEGAGEVDALMADLDGLTEEEALSLLEEEAEGGRRA